MLVKILLLITQVFKQGSQDCHTSVTPYNKNQSSIILLIWEKFKKHLIKQ
jgi:hypothetical protein